MRIKLVAAGVLLIIAAAFDGSTDPVTTISARTSHVTAGTASPSGAGDYRFFTDHHASRIAATSAGPAAHRT